MKDYQVSNHNLAAFFADIQNEIDDHKLLIVTTQSADTGKWSMARLWRAWMETTAQHMAKCGVTMPLYIDRNGQQQGRRPFNKDDAHELFTRNWLGCDENGNRLSWARTGHDGMRQATKGERFNALRKHENWCIEKGIQLFKPRGNEYEQLAQEQEV